MKNYLAKERAKQAQLAAVDRWNLKHHVGTPVIVLRDDGSEFHTTTRSTAWLLGGHSAVIQVEGIAGAYSLSRVSPATPQPA